MMTVSAFAGLETPQATASGVIVREWDGLGIATVLAGKGRGAALASRIRERFGIELPSAPRCAANRDLSFIGTGPGAWLAISATGANAIVSTLREEIGDFASVADQSDGLAVVRLSGPGVRDVLCKLVAVDVDPRGFRTGDAAVTPIGHMGATLWRLDDAADGSAAFAIAVYRSFAESFWHALTEAAAA